MFGVILLTHEGMAEVLLRTAKELGNYNFDGVEAVSVRHYEPVPGVENRLEKTIIRCSRAKGGVLVLTDQFGSTPCNVAGKLCRSGSDLEIVTGLNLPMFLRVLDRRAKADSLLALAEAAVEGGRENVVRWGSVTNGGVSTVNKPTTEPKLKPEPQADPREVSKDIEVVNKLGLHAAAAAKLVHLANSFQAEVFVGREGKKVNAKSILGVLTLAAAQGSVVTVSTYGPDAQQAVEAIAALFADKFGEGE